MTHGLAGLLDDAYLVLKILQRLDEGATPLLEWELDEPLELLSGLMGVETTRRLDLVSHQFMERAELHFTRYWESVAAEA